MGWLRWRMAAEGALAEFEEALDGREEAGRFSQGCLGSLLRRGLEAGASFGDCPADGFGQIRIRVEQMFHGRVTNLEDFGLLESDHICCARFAGEERHLAKEGALAEYRHGASLAAIIYLHLYAAAVHHEH